MQFQEFKPMPYRILCNGTEQKSLEARSGLTLKPSHFSPLHKIRYGVMILPHKKLQDIWEFKDTQRPSYPTEKSLELLKLIVETSSNEGDLVLDCFSGSGTTLVAAEALNRRWIGIDSSEIAIKTTLKRLNYQLKTLFQENYNYSYIAAA